MVASNLALILGLWCMVMHAEIHNHPHQAHVVCGGTNGILAKAMEPDGDDDDDDEDCKGLRNDDDNGYPRAAYVVEGDDDDDDGTYDYAPAA
uniref:Secreted protein n=1 Tax=Chenopodium quinoa TaxID=63459 RepID=A0A803MQ85_CHEQI